MVLAVKHQPLAPSDCQTVASVSGRHASPCFAVFHNTTGFHQRFTESRIDLRRPSLLGWRPKRHKALWQGLQGKMHAISMLSMHAFLRLSVLCKLHVTVHDSSFSRLRLHPFLITEGLSERGKPCLRSGQNLGKCFLKKAPATVTGQGLLLPYASADGSNGSKP